MDKSSEKYVSVLSAQTELTRTAGWKLEIPELLSVLDDRGISTYWRAPHGAKAWDSSEDLRRVVLQDEFYVISPAAHILLDEEQEQPAQSSRIEDEGRVDGPTVVDEDQDGPLQYLSSGVLLHSPGYGELDPFWEVDGDFWPLVDDLYLADEDLQSLVREAKTERAKVRVFTDEERRHFASAEFLGERELLGLCFGVPRYADRDDVASQADREFAKTRIKDAINRGDLPAERNPEVGAGELFYGVGVYRVQAAAAIYWAAARYEQFPDWIVTARAAKNEAPTRDIVSADAITAHLHLPLRDLPPDVADHLTRRLRLIGMTLAQWDEWTAEQRQRAVAMADEQESIARSDAERERYKRAEGRYTVREASEILAARAGEREASMARKLKAAVQKGILHAYEPGRNARYEIGPNLDSEHARSFYEEIYWKDLNAWLDVTEPRIAFRFPAPSGSASVLGADATVEETPEQYRIRVTEVLARHSGNKSAAGRELGISRQRVAQLTTPAGSNAESVEAARKSDPFGRR